LESSNSHRSYEKRTPEGDAEGTFLRPDQPARPTALRGALPCKREDVGISGFRRLQRQAAPVAQRRRYLREAWREIPLIGGVGLGWKPSMITGIPERAALARYRLSVAAVNGPYSQRRRSGPTASRHGVLPGLQGPRLQEGLFLPEMRQ